MAVGSVGGVVGKGSAGLGLDASIVLALIVAGSFVSEMLFCAQLVISRIIISKSQE
jgi:hypothetical protein